MNEKGNKYALAALKDKRAALSGEIASIKTKLAWREAQLRHVDATIQVFEPEFDVDGIADKRPMKRVKLFRQGELSRMVLDALRTGEGPQRTHDIVSAIMLAQGHEETLRTALAPRVRANLQYLQKKQGSVAKIGSGRDARWTLS